MVNQGTADDRRDDNLAKISRLLDEARPDSFFEQVRREIIDNKTLRFELDRSLQQLKSSPTTRERALATTNLQQAIMWLGMDLKRLGAMLPAGVPKMPLQLAKEAYTRYGATTSWKNSRGDPMPDFEALGEVITSAWVAAVTVPAEPTATNPYPNSYDASNTKVDPTADNLKL